MADMQEGEAPRPVRLAEYAPPAHWVDQVHLTFHLGEPTEVHAELEVRANAERPGEPLELHGRDLELAALALDGEPLGEADYRIEGERLLIPDVPERCRVSVTTRIRPADITALEGLYRSGGMYCTQCEPEGFRRITYFPDRPDVMARFTTTLVAERAAYPVLLSNGNPVDGGELAGGRHWARWEDPFPKPAYLFALVAGDLERVTDTYTTGSGREVALHLYTEHGSGDKLGHALESLKAAMAWDEQAYGRECDLDVYQIVAVSDFNMGAMENKGLNLFNTAVVLARGDTATDADYLRIQAIVAHEYFHNWSGNRVTLRDWFQLSLKEGFTVFREQQFSGDHFSHAVQRVEDAHRLRAAQFPEDDGPTAHPVRPDSYIEIANFYTPTVYEKGAEVIRMLYHLLGPETFRAGSDLYFARFDGRAVTTEDFVAVMEEASGQDLTQFRLWYRQAGTPRLHVTDEHDPQAGTYTLHVHQEVPATPGQPDKAPMPIPLAVGLVDGAGNDLAPTLAGDGEAAAPGTRVLPVGAEEQSFTFTGLRERPTPSLLRGFSAPVRVAYAYDDAELAFLLGRDNDEFNRWEAGRSLMLRVLDRHAEGWAAGQGLPAAPETLVTAFADALSEPHRSPALLAEALALPDEAYLVGRAEPPADPEALHHARSALRRDLAHQLATQWADVYDRFQGTGPYRFDPEEVGRRRLRNLALAYLASTGEARWLAAAREQFVGADNMTDRMGALAALMPVDCAERDEALAAFEAQWSHEPEVMDKWLVLQAGSPEMGGLETVRRLMDHPLFSLRNPNRVRAVLASFARRNPYRFHAADGSGYAFLAGQVRELDAINPQIAAALAKALARHEQFDARRAALMRDALAEIRDKPDLSRDTYEIVAKSLEGAG
jgi:aminopeptidase N